MNDKLAKLLKMLTSPYDGEVLAAAGRINAIVAAHGLDWDQVLAHDVSALSREQMQKIYDEGYSRGLEEGRKEGKPQQANWRSTDGPPAPKTLNYASDVMEAAERAESAGLLNDFEKEFSTSMRERISSYGESSYISDKQWSVIERLATKLVRRGYLEW